MKKYLQIEIFWHQILAILLTIFPCSLKIVTIILSFSDENKINDDSNSFRREEDGILEILYVIYPWLILVIFIYLGMKIMRAYISTQIKWYMDIKYISVNKLLMFYGLIGTLFYTIICLITTFVKCSEKDNTLFDYICETKDAEGNSYFASFKIYYETALEYPILEIITILLGSIGFSFYKFYSLMVIKNLSPIHLVFSLPLFYIMRKIVLTISFFVYNDFDKASETYQKKYVLDILEDLLCMFAYFIYLEIIKLNCCNLNYNLRENIITRGQTELCPKDVINIFKFLLQIILFLISNIQINQ